MYKLILLSIIDGVIVARSEMCSCKRLETAELIKKLLMGNTSLRQLDKESYKLTIEYLTE